MNGNLFVALRSAFPADLDATAIEAGDGALADRTWRDIDHASARIANLLDGLNLPAGSRLALQPAKSVDALSLTSRRCGRAWSFCR